MDLIIVFSILGAAMVLFATELIPIDLTALLILGALVATDILTPAEGVAGFANPAPITIAAIVATLHIAGATYETKKRR